MRSLVALLIALLVGTARCADTTYNNPFQTYGHAAVAPHATPNTLCCSTVRARLGLSGSTSFGGSLTSTCASGTSGWAIYPDADGGTALASTSASCTTAGAKVATVSSYTIVAETDYRVCYCSSATTGNFLGVDNASGELNKLTNAFNVKTGAAANSCTSGAPPSTTGALSTDGTCSIPVLAVQ